MLTYFFPPRNVDAGMAIELRGMVGIWPTVTWSFDQYYSSKTRVISTLSLISSSVFHSGQVGVRRCCQTCLFSALLACLAFRPRRCWGPNSFHGIMFTFSAQPLPSYLPSARFSSLPSGSRRLSRTSMNSLSHSADFSTPTFSSRIRGTSSTVSRRRSKVSTKLR